MSDESAKPRRHRPRSRRRAPYRRFGGHRLRARIEPEELDTLVLRCLDKDPVQRPTTRALGESLDGMRLEAARPNEVERQEPTA